MNKETRMKVASELNKHLSGTAIFTSEVVKKFKRINAITPGGRLKNYRIYAAQLGELTIMVWITANDKILVKAQAW